MIEGVKNFMLLPDAPERAARKAERKARRAANFEFRKQNTISGYIASVPDTLISGIALFGLTKPAAKMIKNLSSNLTYEENQTVLNAFDKAFKESSLPEKGAEVVRIGEKTVVLGLNPIEAFADKFKNPKTKKFINKNLNPIEMVRNGDNAFFNPVGNKLLLPETKLSLTNFHEMGHALNCNKSKVWSTIQCAGKPLKWSAPLFASLALFMNKKEETPDHKLTIKDKTINAFRTAAPYMVAAACLPELAEEITASVKGQKIANKVLSKDLARKVFKTNVVAGSTYLISAVALTLGTAIGIKVKDKVMAKRMAKAENSQIDENQKQLLRECKNNNL